MGGMATPAPREHSPQYTAYIGSPAWAAFRIAYYRTHARACAACCATRYVELHHVTYERLGAERADDVVPLCLSCHEHVHHAHRQARDAGSRLSLAAATWSWISGHARRERRRVVPPWAVSGSLVPPPQAPRPPKVRRTEPEPMPGAVCLLTPKRLRRAAATAALANVRMGDRAWLGRLDADRLRTLQRTLRDRDRAGNARATQAAWRNARRATLRNARMLGVRA